MIMEIRFLVDTQLPPSLAKFFKKKGLNATHVINYPLREFTSDQEIIRISTKEERIVVSKDRDFFDHYILKGYPPSVLLLQLGNIKNHDLFSFLDYNFDVITKLFTDNPQSLVLLNQRKIVIY